MYWLAIGAGFASYLMLCALAVAMGGGALRLLRLPLARGEAWLFAPVVALALWTVGLGLLEARLLPGRLAVWPLWALTLVLCAVGVHGLLCAWPASPAGVPGSALSTLGRLRHALGGAGPLLLLGLAVVLPVLALWPRFADGLLEHQGSVWPDGWSYAAFGQYLWEYVRGTEGGLAPLYQYAAHLSASRYVSPALLGFLSPLVGLGDAQAAAPLLLAWMLFVFAAACALFIATQPLPWPLRGAYVVLVLGAGWAANVVYANNYDNAVALAWLPALAAACVRYKPAALSWCCLLGLLVAASIYTYPEYLPFVLGGTALLLAQRVWPERHQWPTWLGGLLASGFVALVLATPFLRDAATFLTGQGATGLGGGVRPGEGLFHGLLVGDYRLAGFWGLGSEFPTGRSFRLQQAVAMLLSALALVGWLRLLWRRQLALAALIALLLGGCLLLLFRYQYTYGAYKLIVLGWWGFCFAVVVGYALVLERLRWGGRPAVGAVLAVALAVLPLPFNWFLPPALNGRRTAYEYEHLRQSDFRAVRDAAAVAGDDGAILLAVDRDVLAEWAMYYLRDAPLLLGTLPRYLGQPHVQPYLERARPVAADRVRYVLTDPEALAVASGGADWPLRWSSGPYRLWEPTGAAWAAVTSIQGPLPAERAGGTTTFWLGREPVMLRLFAAGDGIATLRLERDTAGGGTDAAARLQLTTGDGAAAQTSAAAGEYRFEFPVRAGLTTVTLQLVDLPAASADDWRLLGLRAPRVSLQSIGQYTQRPAR